MPTTWLRSQRPSPCPHLCRSLTPRFALALLAACLPGSHAADFLPPAPPWKGASESLIAPPNDPWITPAERSDLTNTPNYDETVAYLARLAEASPLISLQEFGRTAQGRALYVVVAARDRTFTAEAARQAGRPTLLAQAGIHSGEIDGKDAGLMLLRDLAFRGKSTLLDHANFLFVPAFNADGHERASAWNRPNQRGPFRQGWRTTARNLNLNRDYMKADSPEMRAMLTLLNQWSPSLCLDIHVTDGIDYQYDITFGYHGDAGVPAWSPSIGAWLNNTYRPAVESALKTAGHIPGLLVFAQDDRNPHQGLRLGPAMPRFSHGYGDLRHLPTILVENHSLKPYRQRVLGTYILLESSLEILGRTAGALHTAIEHDRATRPALVPINWTSDATKRTTRDFLGIAFETFSSSVSGATEIRWLGTAQLYPDLPITLSRPTLELRRPTAYWVPATHPEAIDRLALHGVRFETLTNAHTVNLEMYRLIHPRPTSREPIPAFENRLTLTTGVRPEARQEHYPIGSVRVPTDQPLGDLAIALLEPECNDSLFAWGFFLEILQRTEYLEGYVLTPMAERMLAEDPQLKAAFEEQLAADPSFAADPSARMRWFYERSPYYDDRYLLYPVGIER